MVPTIAPAAVKAETVSTEGEQRFADRARPKSTIHSPRATP
jgi:hypothetical protein